MSFRPVKVWLIQCDGLPSEPPCAELFHCYDIDGQPCRVLLDLPHLSAAQARVVEQAGWMRLPNGGHRCPGHVLVTELAIESALGEDRFDDGTP
ncbi:hypothetical protein N8J89_16315 [Crossiella sp. CA-258035]|uniref:hypothetical protein n=1 Tax=Crossiella sp. CA-258035 TaxID=2981138 RepID=UPI0024BCB073|nr:hypothetical protein [Crossiella sp. CA-258035]WHT22563.1 hypothetical protein N8J89_16315 [Crossiella sp. CA-258035]